MTESSELDKRPAPISAVTAPLAEYADRLLLSTGVHVEEGLLIASGQLDLRPELEPIGRALRSGWDTADCA